MRTLAPIVLCAVFLICWLPRIVGAQEDDASPEPEVAVEELSSQEVNPQAEESLEAIRQSSRDFVAAFNNRDARAVAALWTEDGDYIDDFGRSVVGRADIEREYSRFFAEHEEVQMRIVIDSIRLLSESAAIEDGRAFIDPPGDGAPAMGKYTAVHVLSNDKWLMSTVRDTREETASGYQNVADLEWLIGTWTAEEHGAQTVSVCRWVANKSFIERSYTVTLPDGTTTSGVQIVGFNPQEGCVQAWNFSPDGGHSIGVWTRREGGWAAEFRGVLGDGTRTTATNLLTRLDENAYAWQSINRTAGDESLPDSDEVILKRRAEAP